MTENITAALDKLASFTVDEKELIVSQGNLINVPYRWAPMTSGTPSDKVYILINGEVSIRKAKEEVARLGAGELVGETSIANNRLRNATVVAEEPLQVLHFTREKWTQLLSRIPALQGAVNERALARS